MDNPIPVAALKQHIAVLGKTGSGKTYAAKGVVERILSDRGRVCVIDPTGAWHGLRSSASGKRAGFPVVIFGGEHADLPLGGAHGEALAEIIGTASTPAILDTSLMRVGERTKFFADFADALVRKNKGPLHLVIDEAHLFAPQGKVNDPQSGAMLHAANNLVSLGRSRGLRIMMITQRPAKLHKDSLTQIETLVAMRLIAPQDRRAVEDWIADNADEKTGREIITSLATLKTGEGWVWAPELGVLDRVHFPKIKTLDTSRPIGETRGRKAPVLAPIDKQEILSRLETVAAEAVANDPARMKAEIAMLKRQLAAKPAALDRGAIDEAEQRGIAAGTRATLDALGKIGIDVSNAVARAAASCEEAKRTLESYASVYAEFAGKHAGTVGKLPRVNARGKLINAVDHALGKIETGRGRRRIEAPAKPLPAMNGEFTHPQHRVLRALAMWRTLGHETPSREMVAAASGYSPTSGGFHNLLGSLATAGAIGKPQPGRISLLISAGDMTIEQGRVMLLDTLSDPQRKLVDALNGAGTMSREALGEKTEYSATSGGFHNLVGSLTALGLVTKPAKGHVALSDWAQELLN